MSWLRCALSPVPRGQRYRGSPRRAWGASGWGTAVLSCPPRPPRPRSITALTLLPALRVARRGAPRVLPQTPHRAPPAALPHFPHRDTRSPAAAACPRRTGRPPPSPQQRRRPGLTAGRARGRGFPAMAVSLSDPGSRRAPPPDRAVPAAPLTAAASRAPLRAPGPPRAHAHWLRASRPHSPIGCEP